MEDSIEFDAPFFKVLGKNDSGEAESHQGGPVLTKDITVFMPEITASAEEPAPSIEIDAILVRGRAEIGRVQARYQLQTWNYTRSGEHRITRIPPLYGPSRKGDIFLIERGVIDRSLFRLTLIEQDTPEYLEIRSLTGGRKSGALLKGLSPVSEQELEKAQKEQIEREQKVFSLFDKDATVKETRTKKVARSRVFVRLVADYYDGKCALCGQGLIVPDGKPETEAAHIVPRGKMGSDDARNGLALCRSHHWAFDRGMWGVDATGEVVVREDVKKLAQNLPLVAFVKQKLTAPSDSSKAPNGDALKWHMDNVFNKPKPA